MEDGGAAGVVGWQRDGERGIGRGMAGLTAQFALLQAHEKMINCSRHLNGANM